MKKVNDEEILKYLQKGLKRKEISEIMGVSYEVLSYRIDKMRKNGIDIPKYIPDKKDRIIIKLLNEGKSIKQITDELGVKYSMTAARIRRMKDRGMEIPKKKLDKIDEEILKLLDKGENQSSIAKTLNISYTNVFNRIKKMKAKGLDIENYKNKRNEKIRLNEKDKILLKRLEEGHTQADIAEEFGVSRAAVSSRLKKLERKGISKSKLKRKLPDERLELYDKILESLKEGKTITSIANELGVSYSIVEYGIKWMRNNEKEIPDYKKIRTEKTELSELDKKILLLKLRGLSQTKIAEETGKKQSYISSRFTRMKQIGIEIPDNRQKQVKNKEKIIKGILDLANTKGATREQMEIIAKEYGVELPKEKEIETDKPGTNKPDKEAMEIE